MSEELKPCPACNDPSPEISNTGDAYYVRCPHCCMRGPEAGGPTWAAEDWNAMPRRLRWSKELRGEVENLSWQADRLAGWARMKCDEVQRLGSEADWLISTKIVEEWNGRFVGAPNKDNSGYAVYPTKAEAVASWREAARKAVEKNHD